MTVLNYTEEMLKTRPSEVATIKGQIRKAFNEIREQAQLKGLSESFIDGMACAACIFADNLGIEEIELGEKDD